MFVKAGAIKDRYAAGMTRIRPTPHGQRAVTSWFKLRGRPGDVAVGIARLLALASAVIAACGLGYYLFDPGIASMQEGLWLAFTTAATVGYGDVVPTTAGSRVFSVIVVIVGFAVFSLVTASISALMVGRQERQLEHEILHDIHHQMRLLRTDIDRLREDFRADVGPSAPPPA